MSGAEFAFLFLLKNTFYYNVWVGLTDFVEDVRLDVKTNKQTGI